MPQNINLSQYFWYWLVVIAMLPVCKSCFSNLYHLSTNIATNIQLSSKLGKLNTEKDEVNSKINRYHSYSGMKRTIKEEIKVLESNEILIKIKA